MKKTSSGGISKTDKLVKTILNKLPETYYLTDTEDHIIELSGVQVDVLNVVLMEWLEQNKGA